MPYTFEPKQKFAKVYGRNVNVSTKSSVLICRVIRNKPLVRAKRLLEDLANRRRSLDGKYYSKTVREIRSVINSCEKNAEFLGLDNDRLFVHASAHMGTIMRRRRRKASFGSRIKSTNIEIMLVERGKEQKAKVSAKKIKGARKKEETEVDKELKEERIQMEKQIGELQKKEQSLAKEGKQIKELEKIKLKGG